MLPTKVERVRGTIDIMPDEYKITKSIEGRLTSCFESFGYEPIDVPLIEYSDLFLRKSGEEIISRLYDFTFRNRRLCLRPEMTASVMRAYVDNLLGTQMPVRLYFSGAVFRYEKPQRARYRQFTQTGVELIGANGPMSDAEMLHMACKGLDQLGLKKYRCIIGHIGILAEFLEGLGLEDRLRRLFLTNMELLRKDGKQAVIDRLDEVSPDSSSIERVFRGSDDRLVKGEGLEAKRLAELFRNLHAVDARVVLMELLTSLNITLDGSREPGEIADRLLSKILRDDQTHKIGQAMQFMSELSQMIGDPLPVLTETEKLLSTYDFGQRPLRQLRELIGTLEHYDFDWSKAQLDLGLSRGLQYYTGMLFEIHHDTFEGDVQLCGGGRYDDIVFALGGKRETPAAGFSYGIERIRLALESEGHLFPSHRECSEVLVTPISEVDHAYAVHVAERLRGEGLRVEMAVRSRSVTSNFQYADKKGIPFVIAVGSEEQLHSEVTLKDMRVREETRIPLREAVLTIRGKT